LIVKKIVGTLFEKQKKTISFFFSLFSDHSLIIEIPEADKKKKKKILGISYCMTMIRDFN
jgi:hypothetical protein